MRRLLTLLTIALASGSAMAAQEWPPRADDSFVADIYPSRDLALHAVQTHLGDNATIVEKSGRITATNTRAEGTREMSVAFIDKPWAADWSAYSNARQDNLILGRSTSPCGSEIEADSLARKSVVAALLPVVRQRMLHEHPGRQMISDKLLGEVIESNLQSQHMIRDRFVQRFTRPYGDVWYQAMLVDTSEAKLTPIVRDTVRMASHRVEHTIVISIAFLLLMGLIGGTYALTNWLTKGYFVWRLRFAAMTVLLLGAATAFQMIS